MAPSRRVRPLAAAATLAAPGVALGVALGCAPDARVVAPARPDGRRAEITAAAVSFRDAVARRYAGLPDSTQAVARADSLGFLAGPDACRVSGDLAGATLDHYFAGELARTPAKPSLVDDVVDIVFGATSTAAAAPRSTCVNGTARLSPDALGPGGTARYLRAATGGKLVTGDGTTRLTILPGALPFDALVSIAPIADAVALPVELQRDGGLVDVQSAPALSTAPGGRLNASAPLELDAPASALPEAHSVVGHYAGGKLVLLAPDARTDCQNAAYDLLTRVGDVPASGGGGGAASVRAGGITAQAQGTRPPCSGSSSDQWSPFGRVRIFDPSVSPKSTITATHVCGARFRVRNADTRPWIVWMRLATATGSPLSGARGVYPILPARGSAAYSEALVDAEAPRGLTGARVLQLYYGPILLRAVPLTGPLTCP